MTADNEFEITKYGKGDLKELLLIKHPDINLLKLKLRAGPYVISNPRRIKLEVSMNGKPLYEDGRYFYVGQSLLAKIKKIKSGDTGAADLLKPRLTVGGRTLVPDHANGLELFSFKLTWDD